MSQPAYHLIAPMPMRIKTHRHNMNLLLSIVTGGLWIPCWILITWDINRQNRRERERYGREYFLYQQAMNTALHQ